MSMSFIPRNNNQRDEVILRLTDYLSSMCAHAALVAFDDRYFSAARAAYVQARQAWAGCSAARRVTAEAASEAVDSFQRDLRWFTGALRDGEGRVQHRLIAELLDGKLPSDVAKASCTEMVRRANGLFQRLPARTDLSYDASRADALRTSTLALQTATIADGKAESAMVVAGAALRAAQVAFDKAYRNLISVAKATLAEELLLTVFPRFVRSGSATTRDTADSTATATP